MTKSFERRIDALADLFEFLDGFAKQFSIDPASAYAVNFAVEELFTNMVKYSPGGAQRIPVTLECVDHQVRVTLEDHGVESFDVTRPDDESVELRRNERTPGGLGLFMTRQMVDDIQYHHENGRTRITIIKKLES